MKRFVVHMILLLIYHSSFAWINIEPSRRLQLDSLVSNMSSETKKDLYKLHDYIEQFGENDEEKVWMIYGYFAIHTKYDMKRYYDRKPFFQTPEYTINKRRGVCRDFAQAFKKLCDLSHIPCLNVYGKAKMSVFQIIMDLVKFHWPYNGHQWNVVKLYNKWQIMDPTWTKIDSIHKYYEIDKYGKSYVVAKAKIPNRTYYEAIPQNISRTHKPFHPAYLLMDSIPTFKTAFKLDSKRKWIQQELNFTTYLDSVYGFEHPELSALYKENAPNYSKHHNSAYFEQNNMNFHRRHQDKNYSPTLDDFYCHKEEISELATYYELNTGTIIYTDEYFYLLDSLFIRKLENKTINPNFPKTKK